MIAFRKSDHGTTPRRFWTLPELRRLEQLYCWQDAPIADVAEALGRTRMSVKVMAQKLGLHRSTRFMASGVPRWTAGNRPWNVGKKGWTPGGRSTLTRFAKGHRGARTRPVGSERRGRDGIEVKVAEPGKWISKPRAVWLKHFGEIPAGAVVRCMDGNPENCRPKNLRLITRAEHVRLNWKPRRAKRQPLTWTAPIQRAA